MLFMNLKHFFFALSLAGVASLGNAAGGGGFESCSDQSNCILVSIVEHEAGICTGECEFEVCLTLNQDDAGCRKEGSISHTCAKSADTCSALTGFGGASSVEDGTKLVSGATFCQTVAASSFAEFLLKDGSGCSGTANAYGGSCAPRDGGTASCTGNRIGKECIWKFPTPACSPSPTTAPPPSPTPVPPTTAPPPSPTPVPPTTAPPPSPTPVPPTTAPPPSPTPVPPTTAPPPSPTPVPPTTAPPPSPTPVPPTTAPPPSPTPVPPTTAPPPSPTPSPPTTPVPPTPTPTPGAQGDPHFKTWVGEKYDFHGACDLVLVHTSGFIDGVDLDIHIRNTQMEEVFSYISTAAVKLGEDILEVSGDTERATYWVNGVEGEDMTEDTLLSETLAGYPVKYRVLDEENRDFLIHLGQNGTIALTTWNGYVGVDIYDAKEDNFESSVGLLGNYKGERVGRDGRLIQNFNDFGQEWQVLNTEPKLFHDVVGPQHPEKCSVPSVAAQAHRRLSQSKVAYDEAESACAGVSDANRESCIFDVMATGNKKMAHAYK